MPCQCCYLEVRQLEHKVACVYTSNNKSTDNSLDNWVIMTEFDILKQSSWIGWASQNTTLAERVLLWQLIKPHAACCGQAALHTQYIAMIYLSWLEEHTCCSQQQQKECSTVFVELRHWYTEVEWAVDYNNNFLRVSNNNLLSYIMWVAR